MPAVAEQTVVTAPYQIANWDFSDTSDATT